MYFLILIYFARMPVAEVGITEQSDVIPLSYFNFALQGALREQRDHGAKRRNST